MAYTSLKELLPVAEKNKYALGAFNIFNYLTARAVIESCEEENTPVIVQTSAKTVKQLGAYQIMDFLLPLAKKASIPVAVHLDHCTDIALAKECIDAGWSSIMIDASHHTLEENIAISRKIVDYARQNQVHGYISVEGELGAIVGVEDDIFVAEQDAVLADVESSVKYVNGSGVDAFAPAIGTAHGLYKGEPKIDFERFGQIRSAVNIPMVLHGGTGLSPQVFRKLIDLGASKVNVSTAIKMAYLNSSKEFLAQTGDPLKFDGGVFAAVKQEVKTFLKIFANHESRGA